MNQPKVYFDFRNNDFVGQIPANLTRPGLVVDNTNSPDQCAFDSFMCPYKNVKPFGCNNTVFTCSIKGASSNSASALSTGSIAGIGLGAAVLLIGFVVGAVWFFKRDAKVSDIKPRRVPTMYHTEISNPPPAANPQQALVHPGTSLYSSPNPSLNTSMSHSPVGYGQLPDNSTMPGYSAYSEAYVRHSPGNINQITESVSQNTPVTYAGSAHTPSINSGYAPPSLYSAHQYTPGNLTKTPSPSVQTPLSTVSYKAPSAYSQTSHQVTPAALASTVYNPDDEVNESVQRSTSIIQKDRSPKYIDLDQLPYQNPASNHSYQTESKHQVYQSKQSPLEYVSKEITNRSSAMQFANQLPLPIPKTPANTYNPVYYDPSQGYEYTFVDASQIQAYEQSQVDPALGYSYVDPSQLYYVDQDQVQYQDAEHF
ncbi:hypothetical protein HK103_007584 [Boothiomyces macroporosus]|uniref:Uncharacterized protein n=1 Tax=Boothiomyces macroporosus TaxID=261099 RepID=A0AAD5UF68_9FUNG|nr:hypothetical protein HK103_007584 [Boothiomyces macroporosus]